LIKTSWKDTVFWIWIEDSETYQIFHAKRTIFNELKSHRANVFGYFLKTIKTTAGMFFWGQPQIPWLRFAEY
jgi:hypothetical protein